MTITDFVSKFTNYYNIDMSKDLEKVNIIKSYLLDKRINDYNLLFNLVVKKFNSTVFSSYPAVYHFEQIIKNNSKDLIKTRKHNETNEAVLWYENIFLNEENFKYDYSSAREALDKCLEHIYLADKNASSYSFNLLIGTAWTNQFIQNNFENYYKEIVERNTEKLKNSINYNKVREMLKGIYLKQKRFKNGNV